MASAGHRVAEARRGQDAEHHRIVIVGAGFAGLGAAIRLRQAGIEDFVVLERGEDVGGTWNFNTYPGCQCDIPSHLYSLSFAPNPNWSRTYSRQPELWEYLRGIARQHGVYPHIRLRCAVQEAIWDEEAELWRIRTSNRTSDGGEPDSSELTAAELGAAELTAEVLVVGAGPLSEPKLPQIPGIESFQGSVFHSAQWDHGHSLRGERVAVIGTGASSIQIVPRIQPEVARLHVFQRTPPWIVPHRDRPTTRAERWLYRRVPLAQRLVRGSIYGLRELIVPSLMHPRLAGGLPELLARRHLRAQVADPELLAQLTPDYRIGCKRILISNSYYPALQQPGVELVSAGITEIGPRSIVTADGTEREVDTIVLGTGFHVTDMPAARWIRGRGGHTLAERWRGSPRAYLGTTVAGFPNLFLLVGPNTGLGHNSIVFMIESQLDYLLDCLRYGEATGMDVCEVREEVQRDFNAHLQRQLRGSVWTSGGCESWYVDSNGANSTIWPGFTWRYRRRLRRFTPSDYRLHARADRLHTGAPSVRSPLLAQPALVP
jgi:cation diffusion facilitator CzcD-associated flavoprotein CzcO